jgi:hypothetical protein
LFGNIGAGTATLSIHVNAVHVSFLLATLCLLVEQCIRKTKCGHVDKLMHPFTGHWCVVQALPGASYELKFAHDTKQKDKKHASHFCPYTAKLIPFEPLYSADNHYGQLYKPIGPPPYKEAGIKGLHHPNLCKQPPFLLQWATSMTSTF